MTNGSGTKDDPWVLKTPPGSSEYTMFRDAASDPPTIVCQVGGTKLLYDARAITDLHAWLKAQGGWVCLLYTSADAGGRTGAGRRGGHA